MPCARKGSQLLKACDTTFMALRLYKKKRDFTKTPEPAGKLKKRSKTLRFVVQKHRARRLHWDFRLEHRGVLKSWAVPKGPPLRAKERRLAVMVEDHPYSYRTFEGIIPKGEYGAGKVEIWDEGVYAPVSSFDQGLKKGHITFLMLGKKLQGEYVLIRLKDDKNWLLIKTNKKL